MTSTAALQFAIRSMRVGAFTISPLREIWARAARRRPLFATIATLPLSMGGNGLVATVQIELIMVLHVSAGGSAESVTHYFARGPAMHFCL